MSITIVARSGLGGEYITRDTVGTLRRHWLYRDSEPDVISEDNLNRAMISRDLFPDGTSVTDWDEVDIYVAKCVARVMMRFTDLPPSPALARAALPVLRELHADERTRPTVAAVITHLIKSPGVHVDLELLNELQQLAT